MLTGVAAGLSLASACLHAAWNIRLKAAADPLRLSARALPWATALATPPVLGLWLLAGRPGLAWQGWALAAISGGVELAYFRFLTAAYRRGDISAIYPVARGTAPLLAVAAGLGLLGERISPLQAVGVAVLVAGILIAWPPGRGGRRTLALAVATGVCIAGYTLLDRVGVRTGPFWLYAWAMFVSTSLWLLPFRGRGPVAGSHAVGLLTVGSYTLVLGALALAPLALVAPLRESGVVLVSLWGVFRLGEREAAGFKLAGAAAVAAGAVLVTV